ncbi:hypothetical protein NKI51_06335 [Mesorhizobium australicum]
MEAVRGSPSIDSASVRISGSGAVMAMALGRTEARQTGPNAAAATALR